LQNEFEIWVGEAPKKIVPVDVNNKNNQPDASKVNISSN